MGCGGSTQKTGAEPVARPVGCVLHPYAKDTWLPCEKEPRCDSPDDIVDPCSISHYNDTHSLEVITISDFPDLSRHHNGMAICLTSDIWRSLRSKRTACGATIDTVCQTGIDNIGHPYVFTVGCVAGDEESYDMFAALFDPVIELCHGFPKNALHVCDINPQNMVGGDTLDPQYVLSCRVRSCRNIRGYPLPPNCSRAHRRDIEDIITSTLSKFQGAMEGTYYPLSATSSEQQEKMIEEHYLFDKPGTPMLISGGMARDWPDARGIWHTESKNLIVWINEKDHSRIISMDKGGNMKAVFERFCDCVGEFERCIVYGGNELMKNSHLGYISTCPSNLGTGLRAGVHVKLPNLGQHEQFDEVLRLLRLQKRGEGGVNTAPNRGIFDISNIDRMGSSEVVQVQQVVDGVNRLIAMEKKLEAGEAIDELMPNIYNSMDFPYLRLHYNWMAKCLTPYIFNQLKTTATPNGFTLQQAIQCGVDDLGTADCMTRVGCVAGDEESYQVFADLFDPVIAGRHNYTKESRHTTNLNPDDLTGGNDLDSCYIQYVCIRGARSVSGFALPPQCTTNERTTVEEIAMTALATTDGEFTGKYYSLKDLTEDERVQLQNDDVLFDMPTCPLVVAAGMNREWPDARGIWINEEKNFVIWINERDHFRIISKEEINITAAFQRYCDGLKWIEAALKETGHTFMHNDHLGYIVTCPNNLGTGLYCSVQMRLPFLTKDSRFESILKSLFLQKKGIILSGASEELYGVYELSNMYRMGSTEVEQVQCVIDGVHILTDMEQRCEKNASQFKLFDKIKSMDSIIPSNFVDEKLNKNYKQIQVKSSNMPVFSSHNNWMSRTLTEELFDELHNKVTDTGFTFDNLIQSGVDYPVDPLIVTDGVVAGDEQTYKVFAPLLDLIIESRHTGYNKTMIHKSDLEPKHLDAGDDLDTNFVRSCRIRTGRSIRPLPLPPHYTRRERREVEHILISAMTTLKGLLKGIYYPRVSMTSELNADHFLLDHGMSLVSVSREEAVSTCIVRDWPDARGIWRNADQTLKVLINQKDHARVISMRKGGNMKAVFERFCSALQKVEASVKKQGYDFMWNDHLGYIIACPSDLGTGLRASVHIKLPKLRNHVKFESILVSLRLEKRGMRGIDETGANDEVFDISNLDRLGSSEVEQVQKVIDGVRLLIVMEKALMDGQTIDVLIPESAKH